MSNKITLEDIASLKKTTRLELQKYLLQQKGINVPDDPDYILPSSIIKAIDPILYFNLKYNRLPIKNEEESKPVTLSYALESSSVEADDSTISTPVNSSKGDVKRKLNKRAGTSLIGIVKWFDYLRDFGFIVTNKKGVDEGLTDLDNLVDIYINSKEWKSSSYPNEDELVVFTLRNVRGKLSACNVSRLEYNKESLMLALEYRSIYAKIVGVDARSSKSFDIHIVAHILDRIQEIEGGCFLAKEAFCEYLLCQGEIKQDYIISAFLKDEEAKKSMRKLFLTEEVYQSTEDRESIFRKIQDLFVLDVFDYNDIKSIGEIPSNVNLHPYFRKLREMFIDNIDDNQAVVRNVFLKWEKSVLIEIFPDETDTELPLELRLLLLHTTGNKNWIRYIDYAKWDDVQLWLNSKSLDIQKQIIQIYFKSRDKIFLEQHPLGDSLSNELCKLLLEELLVDTEHDYQALIEFFVSHLADTDIMALAKIRLAGRNISFVYPRVVAQLNRTVLKSETKVRTFLNLYIKNDISLDEIFTTSEKLSDELLTELFIITGEPSYLNQIIDLNQSVQWIDQLKPNWILKFIKSYCELTDGDDEAFLPLLKTETVAKSLKVAETDESYQLLQMLPSSIAIDVVCENFAGTKLYDLIISEQWQSLKSEVPYVVFDLESDGENIREFAFRSEENMRSYEGEEQLNSLMRVLRQKEIVVGHKIKDWDMKILEAKGLKTDSFVWDTLEIEILINPCRYAYSLHTEHHAKEDTELTDRLFWNQLYRLSKDKNLCLQLRDFLPRKILQIIEELQQPYFADHFRNSSYEGAVFFQNLCDIDRNIIDSLEQIAQIPDNEKTLIIAPQNLWGRIAQYIKLSFPVVHDGIDYFPISKNKLEQNPCNDIFLQAVLQRFIEISKTPIVANLAQYLRINYLPDNALADYLDAKENHFDCIDVNDLENLDYKKNYQHIYFIGCELGNRLHQYGLPYDLTATDFISKECWIPMRMGGSNYMVVSKDERTLLQIELPADISNCWVERMLYGKYRIYYSFDYNARIAALTKRYANADIKHVNWQLQSSNESSRNISIVKTGKVKSFDCKQKRVSSISRYRSMYWVYQLRMLQAISNKSNSHPIIYVINDQNDLEKVVGLAKELGFYVPSHGTLVNRMEYITRHALGLLVISKDDFLSVINIRQDTAYNFVWDQMTVDKCRMMWSGQMPFGDEAKNEDEEKNLNEITTIDATPKSCLLSAWPVYEYYYKYICANSTESQMYILEPYFDDYNDLAEVWNTELFAPQLWSSEDEYENSLFLAKKYFHDESLARYEADIKKAMETIRCIFLNDFSWRDYQEEVLTAVLSKKTNYLVSIATGGGKSILFQGPALYRSTFTNKLSIVITPLKALMEDQIRGLHEKGFYTNVEYLNGDRTYQEIQQIYRKINGGEIALLYVAPERFRSRAFLNALATRISNDDGLEYFIFDEAHCISQWGQEFRPEYLNVMKWCENLDKHACITMYSATVTKQIEDDLRKYIPDLERHGHQGEEYNPIRNHIGMTFRSVEHNLESRIDAAVGYIKENSIDWRLSRMLIFCSTRKQTEEAAAALQSRLSGISEFSDIDEEDTVGCFHAGMKAEDRKEIYDKFKDKNGGMFILCATKAFGMGMDIPNIHYVIHLTPPSVLEDYLQEVGRAGRNENQYKAAGFNEKNLIPTVCLCSKEDFRKAKELLMKSMLSWLNLGEINAEIIKYINKIQPLIETQRNPVVVPNDLWYKDVFNTDTTAFKLGQFWLERMERIKLGFLCPAHINLKIFPANVKVGDALFATTEGRKMYTVYEFVKRRSTMTADNVIQIALNEISSVIGISINAVLHILIKCVKSKLISIEQYVRCRVARIRYDEVSYMLQEGNNIFALHIIIECARSMLQDRRLHEEFVVDQHQCAKLLSSIMNESDVKTKPIIKILKNGKQETREYMPWFKEDEKERNKGLSVAENYKKDLFFKRAKHIFTLIDIIPGVTFRSFIDAESKEVKQSISLEKGGWEDYLSEFEHDCITFLKYLNKKNEVAANERIKWAEAISDLNLKDNVYQRFANIVRFLHLMGYIAADGLLPMGIEVRTTDRTELPIEENPKDKIDSKFKQKFEEMTKMRLIRLAVMDTFSSKGSGLSESERFISEYFKCVSMGDLMHLLSAYHTDNSDFMKAFRAEAIKNEEERLGEEQKAIYKTASNANINVIAGPGSGKTHVLTLRCANLIYRNNVPPKQILVLAYNRAVVVELRNRLDKLFRELGLSRSASQLHVYTFSALAKKVCGKSLDGKDMKDWEPTFLEMLKKQKGLVKVLLGDIRYIMIDEFQDITQTRLEAMFTFKNIYPDVSFFTIGDPNQSIYGFDKKIAGIPKSTSPKYYYDQLDERMQPQTLFMGTNYRSYQKILDEASFFLSDRSLLPKSADIVMEKEPQEPYIYIIDNQKEKNRQWYREFSEIVKFAKEKEMQDIAIFFRSNNEVYRGYSQLKNLNLQEVRIRIQGASSCDLFKVREIYAIIKYLRDNGGGNIELANDVTKKKMRTYIKQLMTDYPNWDRFYLDFGYTLILDYLDGVASEEGEFSYADMADFIKEAAGKDDGQIYKIYDSYRNQRIDKKNQLNIVLTTMHKVKGLEFDVVIITPSFESLPIGIYNDDNLSKPLTEEDIQAMEEEKRLMYVAYTRAKKYLRVYRYNREVALDKMERCSRLDEILGYCDNDDISKLYLSFMARPKNFNVNRYIEKNVKKNDPLILVRHVEFGEEQYYILHEDRYVGRLTKKEKMKDGKSAYRKIIERINKDIEERSPGDSPRFQGFFVNEVYAHTYQETLDYDSKNTTTFAKHWSLEAIQQGYVYIVDFAGYGKEIKK